MRSLFRCTNIFIQPHPEKFELDGAQMDSLGFADVPFVRTFIRQKRCNGKRSYGWKIRVGAETDLVNPVQRAAEPYSAVPSIRLGTQSLTPAMAVEKNGTLK